MEIKLSAHQILNIIGKRKAQGFRFAEAGGYRIEETDGQLHIRDRHHHDVLRGDALCMNDWTYHCRRLSHIAMTVQQYYKRQEMAETGIQEEEHER